VREVKQKRAYFFKVERAKSKNIKGKNERERRLIDRSKSLEGI
jgi:hypothetical protein